MSSKDTGSRDTGARDEPAGWGLSSEQYDEDKVLEVDTRSVDYERLREEAKDPHATWSDADRREDTEEDTGQEQADPRGEPATEEPADRGDGSAG
ncbi:MAG TPA: hypothetical protein VFJ14_09465 [Nocardioidaceae bacterium]|nr:hypothetical protein [Nocardioidaceae bacterium]